MAERPYVPEEYTRQPLPEVRGNTPGGPVPESEFWEPRLQQSTEGQLKEIGVRTPEEEYFNFEHGEKFAMVREKEGDARQPVVRLHDGREVSFETWRTLRTESLRAILEQADPDYAQAYMTMLRDHPEMAQLNVHAGSKEQYPTLEFTGGFWKRPENKDENPSIVVEMSSEGHYQQLMVDRETSARRAADMLGIDFEELKQNPKLLKLFVFLHEVGHAQDYIMHYRNDPRNGTEPDYDPVSENQKKRDAEMASLPVPGANPVRVRKMLEEGTLGPYFQKYKAHYETRGIDTIDQLVAAQEEAYRSLPSEHYPDMFAARVLRNHWEEFGFGKKSGTM